MVGSLVQILKSQSSIVASCSKYIRALTFENLYQGSERDDDASNREYILKRSLYTAFV
jgi:hypothetical protein